MMGDIIWFEKSGQKLDVSWSLVITKEEREDCIRQSTCQGLVRNELRFSGNCKKTIRGEE